MKEICTHLNLGGIILDKRPKMQKTRSKLGNCKVGTIIGNSKKDAIVTPVYR